MKHTLLVLLFFAGIVAHAQDYKFIYYFDANLSFTSKEKAAGIGKGYKTDGLVVVDCYNKASEKIVFTATFKDSSLQTMHGDYKSYFKNGQIENDGKYIDNEMNGVWKTWNKYGFITDSIFYESGLRTGFGKYQYAFNKYYKSPNPVIDSIEKDGYILTYSFTDSLKNTCYQSESSYKKGVKKVNFEVFFTGNAGLLKEYDSTGNIKEDSVFDRMLAEAEFSQSGEEGWRRFLQKNINSEAPNRNNAPNGNYTAIIKFIVNEDGSISGVEAETDPGYGAAAEVIRVIKLSPKWKPAKKYGKLIKSYRRQPMTFSIQNG
jgi:antitoxin component YwqK of YwqJK toxin-antitoxin module